MQLLTTKEPGKHKPSSSNVPSNSPFLMPAGLGRLRAWAPCSAWSAEARTFHFAGADADVSRAYRIWVLHGIATIRITVSSLEAAWTSRPRRGRGRGRCLKVLGMFGHVLQVVTKLSAAAFGDWEKAKFAPEAEHPRDMYCRS